MVSTSTVAVGLVRLGREKSFDRVLGASPKCTANLAAQLHESLRAYPPASVHFTACRGADSMISGILEDVLERGDALRSVARSCR